MTNGTKSPLPDGLRRGAVLLLVVTVVLTLLSVAAALSLRGYLETIDWRPDSTLDVQAESQL